VMSSADRPGPVDHALLAVGTATYDCPDFEPLDKVPEALRGVVDTLTGLGFSIVAETPGYDIDPTADDLSLAVQRAAAAAPVVVVYYTGHGAHPERDTYYLVTKQSLPANLRRKALAARDLLELLTRRDDHSGLLADQPTALVILDCCFSGSAGMEMVGDALRDIGNPNTWVIASAGPLEYAQQGLFAKAFCDALRRPTIGASQDFVHPLTIVDAVNKAHAGYVGQEALLFQPAAGVSHLPQFFPNPSHRPGVAGLTVAEQQHWLSRVRGGPTTTGFYLTGRTGRVRAAQNLAGWMTNPGAKGMAIVTGSPGTGKSALLALPVLLTQRALRPDLVKGAQPGSLVQRTADLLPPDTQIIAVHARGLNTDQAAGAIAQALGRAPDTASALLEDLDATPERGRVVAVDALDEAASPATLLTSLLLPLSRQPGLRVAVAARRHVLSSVREADLTIDLDSGQYRDPQALTDYVYRLLIASKEPDVTTPYRPATPAGDRGQAAAVVAAAIARRATASDEGAESFLIGRLMALSVRGRAVPVDITSPSWQSELPASIAEAFDQDLARLGDNEPMARTLLAALGWAKGPGLPWENIWVPVARALAEHTGSQARPAITDDDVRWLLTKAGAYVVEDRGPGRRSVYRPFHDLLAAHLRGAPSTRPAGAEPAPPDARQQQAAGTEKAITGALLATVSADGHARDWTSAHPYLRTYLAQHATAAGPETVSALAREPGFLAVADPITLTPLLPVTGPRLRDLARIYRRARPMLGDDPHANAAYLDEATRALNGTAATEDVAIRPLYRTHLASVRRDDSLLTLTGHTDVVCSVAFGTGPDGRLLLASGSLDNSVRLWDPVTGAPVGAPLTGHAIGVASVAFGTGPDGRLLLASGGSNDGTVRLWDPATGTPVGEPLTGHDEGGAVAFGTGPDGRLLLACGGNDGTVRLWDPATGTPMGKPLTGHTRPVTSLAFGTRPGERLLLASGAWDGTVRLWDPATSTPVGKPLTGDGRVVGSVAFGTGPGGRLLLASSSSEGTVRLWDPIADAPVGEPLPGHTGPVAFAAGPGGRLLLASAGEDKTVRLWDPAARAPVGEPLTGHTGLVNAVAFGTGPGGRLLLASSGGDGTVRLWDPATGSTVDEPLTGHTESVNAVAFGTGPGGRLLLTSGSSDETVRLWDPVTGAPVGTPLTGHTDVVASVAFGTGPGGRLLLASLGGGWEQAVRLWDPATGAPVGEPLTSHTGWVTSVALATGQSGRLVLASTSGGLSQTVQLWDPATGAPMGEPLIGHTQSVGSVALTAVPGGRLLLASGGGDRTVRLWDPATGARVGEPLTGHTGPVRSVAFGTGPGGRLLLASGGGWDQTIRLWDPATGAPVGEPLTGHTVEVTSVAFATGRSGRLLLASGGKDRTVRLWDPATRSCIATVRRRSSVQSLASANAMLAIGDDEGLSVIELDW
jgi:WD40 repeat protein